MNNKPIDIICLSVTAILFGGCALWNLFQTDRPTFSESEKRELASMPKFSISSLIDGSYFSGISAYISDTFPERDKLVELSGKMDLLKGIDYTIGGEESFSLLNNSADDPKADEPDEDEIAAAFSELFDDPDDLEEENGSTLAESDNDPQTADNTETEASDVISDAETKTETELPETTAPVTEAAEHSAYTVKAIYLSHAEINMTVGGTALVSATVDTDNPDGAVVYWSTSDTTVATVSVNPS